MPVVVTLHRGRVHRLCDVALALVRRAVFGGLGLALSVAIASAVTITPDGRSGTAAGGRYAATGHVRCGDGVGTAQLVGSSSVIVTAAHVLYGRSGVRAGACTFTVTGPGGPVTVAIDTGSIRAGTRDPYDTPAALDWAVARLGAPVPGVAAYGVGGGAATGSPVTLVSARTLPGGRLTAEACTVRRVVARAPGQREMMLDCSAEPGDSGAALLAGHQVVGIYVGFRSAAPGQARPFGEDHYNFALTLDGALRAAIRDLSGR